MPQTYKKKNLLFVYMVDTDRVKDNINEYETFQSSLSLLESTRDLAIFLTLMLLDAVLPIQNNAKSS